MADYGFDGMIKVGFVPTIVSVDGPTVAELTAGVDLEGRLTADGLNVSSDTATIDTSKLNSTAQSETIGRDSYTVSVTYVRGSDTEATDVQDALVRGASGYLVVRRNVVSSTAWTAAQEVEVYPVVCHRPNPAAPAQNALQTVEVGMSITDGTKVRAIDNPATVAA
jgi:hypothetical protein